METDMIIGLICMLILITMGVLIILGKGDWMISGYNTASSEEKTRYNVVRLRIITGLTLLGYPLVVFLGKLIGLSIVVLGIMYLPVLIVALVLGNTWAKRK